MGLQSATSKAISETVNKSMTNVMMSSSASCSQTNVATQELNFNDIVAPTGCNLEFSGISQTSVQTPNFSCSSDNKNDTELSAKFKTELEQNAKAAVSGIGGAVVSKSDSETINKLTNEISTNINVSNVSSCVQDNLSQQKMQFGKIQTSCPAYCNDLTMCKGELKSLCDMSKCTTSFKNISQSLTQAAVANCTSKNSNVQKIINEAASKLSQKAESKNEGINVFASLGSSMIPLFACIALSVLLSVLASMFKDDISKMVGMAAEGGMGGDGGGGMGGE